MTEVLFVASVAFAGYVIYVLMGELMTSINPTAVEAQPEPSAEAVEMRIPEPTQTRAKLAKTRKVTVIVVNISESVGLAAGSIWNYLHDKGPTAVAKLVRELPEDDKTLQRSIGWLAREDKITLETIGQAETITLKNN